jgi:hypothetical protein
VARHRFSPQVVTQWNQGKLRDRANLMGDMLVLPLPHPEILRFAQDDIVIVRTACAVREITICILVML